MTTTNTYTNTNGVECIQIIYDDGTSWSGIKADYDLAQAEIAAQI